MSTVFRVPKSELYEDPLHDMNYLNWVQEQVTRVTEFAELISEVEEEFKRKVVSPAKIYKSLAGYTSFLMKNVAFRAIYQEYAARYNREADQIYNVLYLKVKNEVTNYFIERGKKYKKKDATGKEIEMEMTTFDGYSEYIDLKNRAVEFEKKAETQSDIIDTIRKHDRVLDILQKSMTMELKFLYLE